MRVITKILIVLLTVTLITAAIPQVSAKSDATQSSSPFQTFPPSIGELSKLRGPQEKNYLNFNKLVRELDKTENKVIKYFEKHGARAMVVGAVDKTLTQNSNGTWHVTIDLTVQNGLYANVYDYLYNLVPIPGSFGGLQPSEISDGIVAYYGIPSGTYTIVFDATRITSGSVADQPFVFTYGFGAPGGFIFSTRAIG